MKGKEKRAEAAVTKKKQPEGHPGISNPSSTEQALTYSLSLLTATLESTTDGILVVDLQGKYTQYNQRLIELWQIPFELKNLKKP